MSIKRVLAGVLLTVFLGTVSVSGKESLQESSGFPTELLNEQSLPTRWRADMEGKGPVIRNQHTDQNCWALASVSALEAALLPERKMVFSADHMVFGNSFSVDEKTGGDYIMSMAYLTSWQGPVLESEDVTGDGASPEDLKAAVHVQEIQLIEDADLSDIKRAVKNYGAVQTALFMNRKTVKTMNYNRLFSAYYCPTEEISDHEVIIIGWDDNYSRFRFGQTPERDGAFICQNTWGSEFGEDGIFYVSYCDPQITKRVIVYTDIEDSDNYSNLYQTDTCGWQGNLGYNTESCWFANVYKAEAQEEIAAVGFYAAAPNTKYEVYFDKNCDEEDLFCDKVLLRSGSLKEKGYYTVRLDTPFEVEKEEQFAIIVKVETPGASRPVAVEYRSDNFTQNVILDGKSGYISRDGERWSNCEKTYEANVCLKAYAKTEKN